MRPLYDARIEDLGPGDFLRVECIACGHDEDRHRQPCDAEPGTDTYVEPAPR